MEGITLTLFGLIVAYLLPGMVVIYGLTFWFPGLMEMLKLFATNDSNPWFFLLFVFSSLIFGLILNSFRWFFFEKFRKKRFPFSLFDFKKLDAEFKLNAFLALLAENYRYYQFAGCMVIVLPVIYLGWLIKYVSAMSWGNIYLSIFVFLVVEAMNFMGALVAWKRYIERFSSVLGCEEESSQKPDIPLENVPPLENRQSSPLNHEDVQCAKENGSEKGRIFWEVRTFVNILFGIIIGFSIQKFSDIKNAPSIATARQSYLLYSFTIIYLFHYWFESNSQTRTLKSFMTSKLECLIVGLWGILLVLISYLVIYSTTKFEFTNAFLLFFWLSIFDGFGALFNYSKGSSSDVKEIASYFGSIYYVLIICLRMFLIYFLLILTSKGFIWQSISALIILTLISELLLEILRKKANFTFSHSIPD